MMDTGSVLEVPEADPISGAIPYDAILLSHLLNLVDGDHCLGAGKKDGQDHLHGAHSTRRSW